ncbi:MAG TPA: tetratricopeptide repeat protein, partial [Lacipirellulaceae bacterium]|nr:tetratricopeptide repeat protein [Lacipirellulaceae bacterium]
RLRLAEADAEGAARTQALEGAIADANAVVDAYEDRFPETGRALYRRGRAERLLERYSDAVDSLSKAIQQVPAGQSIEYLSDAYLFRGICWYHIGSYDLARGDFEQASSIGSGFQDPRVFLWIGYTHHAQGNYRQAIEAYSNAISKAPSFALAHVNKGRAYMDLREYRKAIESFNHAIRHEPNVGDNYYNVGMAYIKLEDFEKAVEFLRLALKQENPQPKMYRAMATALRALGRNDLAAEYESQAGG